MAEPRIALVPATPASPSAPRRPGRLGLAGWMLFDWAQQPFFTLVTTFVFAPYFAARVAATATEGQALWALAVGAAGALIAIASPVLGAIADVGGRPKAWTAAFSMLFVVGCLLLWLAEPGASERIPLVLAGFVLASVGAEFGIVFTNALLPRLVPPDRIGSLSGSGWALGYAGGLVSLALTLAFFTADPATGRTLAGVPPLFDLDAHAFEGERLTGPFAAFWFLVFALPFFAFTPGRPRGAPLAEAARQGVRRLAASILGLRDRRLLFHFLLSRMLYQDGLNALFAFGGIYAAGVFGWSTTEIGVFGILLTIAATFGAWLGGRLDDRLGPRPVILAALAILCVSTGLILTVTRDGILGFPLSASSDGVLFASGPERLYVSIGLLIGIAAGPVQAASRTLLVEVARPEEITQAFGLFALSGRITAFAAPLAVATVTELSGSQRIGIAPILIFLALGLLALWRLNAGNGERR